MFIGIELLVKEMKENVVKLGGDVRYYDDLDECILAIFGHHELKTHGDHVVITDDHTGEKLTISVKDFYKITLS